MTTILQFSNIEECGAGQRGRKIAQGISATVYLLLGVAFGYVLMRSEVISWFRIQEMFHFQSFRMYGIIGSAVATAALSIALIKRTGMKSIDGEKISIPAKHLGSGIRYAAGGILFGLGWARLGLALVRSSR